MVRFARPRIAAILLLCSLGLALPAGAQENVRPAAAEATDTAPLPQLAQALRVIVPDTSIQPRRPAPLVPLYVAFGALQVLDTHSTSRALRSGGAEANPVMKSFAGSTAGMLAVKAAGTTGVIYISEKMWRKNRKAAIIFMIAANSAMAWVVQNNYRVSAR